MAVTDKNIDQWSSTDNNAPSNSTPVGTDLGANIRNIKSVYRTLSVNKFYENHLLSPISAPTDYSGLIIYQFQDDLTGLLPPSRKVIARDPSTGVLVGGYVSESVFTGGITVAYVFYTNWSSSYSELYLGSCNEYPRAFPIDSIGGVFALKGPAGTDADSWGPEQSVDVTFANPSTVRGDTVARIVEYKKPTDADAFTNNIQTTVAVRSLDYRVHIQACKLHPEGFPGTVDAGQNYIFFPYKIVKHFTKFTATFAVSPQPDKYFYYDWFITFPEYN